MNTPSIEKQGSKWAVITDGGVTTFKTKKDAAAYVESLATPEPTQEPEVTEGTDNDGATHYYGDGCNDDHGLLTDEVIAGMERVERLLAAKAEKDLLGAWRAAGQQGERPATPFMDWFADPNTKAAPKPRKSTAVHPRTVVSEEQEPVVRDFVVAARAAGESWKVIGQRWAAEKAETTGLSLSEHQLYSMNKAAAWS